MVKKSKITQSDIQWVATQKIHGANFSICYNFINNTIKYRRRNDFISNEIPVILDQNKIKSYFIENFFDAADLVNTFHNQLIKVKNNINKQYKNVIGIHIYGQYFGGYWPGQVQCKKRVQTGVYYTPLHQFMVLDIKLIHQNHKQEWVNVTDIQKMVGQTLKYIPIYKKDKFQDFIQMNTQIDSTIPQLLKLQKLQNNICEGFIIRPNKNFIRNQRYVFKKKNKQFYQKVNQKAPVQHKIKVNQKNQFTQKLLVYLNDNRIESGISKFPDFKTKYILKGMVINDIYSDAKKQGYQNSTQIKIVKQAKSQLDRIVLKYIEEYLKENNFY